MFKGCDLWWDLVEGGGTVSGDTAPCKVTPVICVKSLRSFHTGLYPQTEFVQKPLYRVTSPIRNRAPPQDLPRPLGMALL